MRSLRFDGETTEQFRARSQRALEVARVLVRACLKNVYVQELIEDDALPYYTEAGFRQCPVVRVDYDEAFAIGGVGECIAHTKSKAWGAGPRILPLEEFDHVDPRFICYTYKPTSKYNRRFNQRKRMKELLGRRYRPLVERAKCHRHTQAIFLEHLTDDEANAIRRIFKVEPRVFWRACRGRVFLTLPPLMLQLELFES